MVFNSFVAVFFEDISFTTLKLAASIYRSLHFIRLARNFLRKLPRETAYCVRFFNNFDGNIETLPT